MSSSKPDRIVLVRDRRQGRRILTLKNFRNAAVAVVVLIAAVTIYAKFRTPKTADNYGRLYQGQIQTPAVNPKQPDIIQEAAPISDADGADPTILSAAARAQYLGTDTPAPAPSAIAPAVTATTATTVVTATTATTATDVQPAPAQTPPPALKSTGVTIVGGAEGVSIVKEKHEPPALGGGFGKPPG
jgi:hypothetical protein